MHSTYFVQFVEVSMLKTLKQMVLAVSDKVPVFWAFYPLIILFCSKSTMPVNYCINFIIDSLGE